ncbi:MAG: hypothetical protein ACLS9Q_13335 [[Clostridium] scindens]
MIETEHKQAFYDTAALSKSPFEYLKEDLNWNQRRKALSSVMAN